VLEIIQSIVTANIIAIGIILVSYIIERNTRLRLFIDHYTWIKSERQADILTSGDSFYFFLVLLGRWIYDIKSNNIDNTFVNHVIWFVLSVTITVMLAKVHRRYQKTDPGKADDNYSW